MRLYKLGAQSLWYDETVSAFLAGQPARELIAHTARDIHPPGYYLLLHFWALMVGHREFALAYLSLIFGVLLIPLTYALARCLVNKPVAIGAALLTAFSPYHVWYAQEVRMYTLAAALGLAATFWALRALAGWSGSNQPNAQVPAFFWLGYLICATVGLYTLYYFAFLLVVLNLMFLGYALLSKLKPSALISWFVVNGLLLLAYLPWLPIAWRQAINPPVPPWRTRPNFWPMLVESWSALSLGQSVEPKSVWPILLLTLALFGLGLSYVNQVAIRSPKPAASTGAKAGPFRSGPWLFLLAYTFGPWLLIYLLSFWVPLYHVRYIFTYSPAFYILLGAGLVWLAGHTHLWAALGATGLLLVASLFSIYQLHFNPRYQADDYRAAVGFIQSHWQPGDAILINAGYTYTAFLYYADFPTIERQRLIPYRPPANLSQPLLLQTGTINGDSQLGWGDPRSDFYAMSSGETMAALAKLSNDYSRLWMLRAYDTVTDPAGLIRAWLAGHAIPIEDELFSGESNIRAQGFLLPHSTQPASQATIQFEDGMALAGWRLPEQVWQPGQTVHLQLWWMATAPPGADYKMSLKLWTSGGELAAQGRDEWVAGNLYRATAWPIGQTVYHPAQITLPANLPPGQYWLNVELYHPETIQPLPQLDGSPAVTLGPVTVAPTP